MVYPSFSINTPPPIYNLDVYTLWKIFWMNTDMFTSTPIDLTNNSTLKTRLFPMDDLRRTSQVCRFWREVALGSPVLWGRVIDLDALPGRTSWGSEVVARAAHAPLCIKGSQQSKQRCIQKWSEDRECCVFFKDLLDRHWPRIRKLEIWIDYAKWRDHEKRYMSWEPLLRPAPMLESFSLISYQDRSKFPISNQSDTVLFDGSAPLLRSFEVHWLDLPSRMLVTKYIIHAPWLRNLRHLVLQDQRDTMEILAVLSDTPLLESLDIKEAVTFAGELSGEFATISLPELRHLDINGSLWAVYGLLKCMRPSTTMCSLDLNIERVDYSSEFLYETADQVFQFVQPYLARRPMIHFKSLAISHHFVSMHILPFGTGTCSGCDCGGIKIQYREPRGFDIYGYPTAYISRGLLLPLLTTQPLTRTKIDKLEVEDVSPGIRSILPAIFSSGHPLSVTRMQVPSRFIQLMMRIPINEQSSHIQTLEPRDVPAAENTPGILLRFLNRQREIGKPVSTLILPSKWYCPGDSELASDVTVWDWRVLDEIHGLRVVWGEDGASADGEDGLEGGSGEYICGSGAPETLDFSMSLTL